MTLEETFQTHLRRSRPPTSTMKKTCMPDLTRRRWSKPSTNSCSGWRSKRGFKDLATLLSQLPKLAQGSASSMSVAEAMEDGFLPALDKDQADMFTSSEFLLYRHAQDHRLLSRDILGYPNLFKFDDILGLSTRRFLSCRVSRIAPFDRMNVAFLLYADNAVYQTCTPTVKSTVERYRDYFCGSSPGLGPPLPLLRQFIGHWAV